MGSVKPCTGVYMLSTVEGMGMRRHWYSGPPVKEVTLPSTKDGEITRSPDPVTMIEGDLTWFNNTPDDLMVNIQIVRAPRSIVAQNPSTVVIQDAWTWAKGLDPRAEYPSVMQDGFGGRAQINRPETSAKELKFGRYFRDGDKSTAREHIDLLPSRHLLHFRYIAAVHTPGTFTTPTEFDPRYEAHARYTKLRLYAGPVGSK